MPCHETGQQVCPYRPCHTQAIAEATRFQLEWDLELRLLRHDCRHHTEALVARLTGRRQTPLPFAGGDGLEHRKGF